MSNSEDLPSFVVRFNKDGDPEITDLKGVTLTELSAATVQLIALVVFYSRTLDLPRNEFKAHFLDLFADAIDIGIDAIALNKI